ncbi:hypothetical protein [Xanthomonas hortorum]|nr:hypothetical protein [Xanthomonas hortorum]UUF01689.1 hypothetical protein NDY25_17430 [Xanthomonas hortorum pv. pelargonii]
MNSRLATLEINHLPKGGQFDPPSKGDPDNRLAWLAAMGIAITGPD